jgi:hypothetical protein
MRSGTVYFQGGRNNQDFIPAIPIYSPQACVHERDYNLRATPAPPRFRERYDAKEKRLTVVVDTPSLKWGEYNETLRRLRREGQDVKIVTLLIDPKRIDDMYLALKARGFSRDEVGEKGTSMLGLSKSLKPPKPTQEQS